jgi:DNA-binding transcriptional ArsR family regulator
MHRVPASRADWRVIDDERVCGAIEALEASGDISGWATLFASLADVGRLSLLLAIHAAEPISVSDLAVATGLRDTAASQALRRLRDLGLVATERHGKIVRYTLASPVLHELLHQVARGEQVRR